MAGFRTNDPDGNAARLRARFRRADRWSRYRYRMRRFAAGFAYSIGFVLIVGGIASGIVAYMADERGWSMDEAWRHMSASPNCDAARAVGLAPSRRGEPGYYNSHDRDQDGIACEVWPR